MKPRQVRYPQRPSYRQQYTRPNRRKRSLPQLKPWQRRGLGLIAVLVVIVIALEQLFAIRTITVQPAVHQATIRPEVQQALHRRIGQGDLLTLDTGELTKDLLATDVILKNVTIERQWPHGLLIEVDEKVASLGWETAGQTYIVDHNGVILEPATTTDHLEVIQDDSNLPVQVGEQVASQQFVAFCQDLMEQIPNTGLSITKLEIHDTTFDLYVTTNKGYQIIFDTSRPVTAEIGDLQATLKTLAQQKKSPAKYIDLRIAGRAYYQ